MTNQPELEGPRIQRLRHDLKNVFTALRSGCDLVQRDLGADKIAEALEILAEMRKEVRKGSELADQLRAD